MWKKAKKLRNFLVKSSAYRLLADAEEIMELDRDFNMGGDERIAFGPMAKGHKKYGSVARSRKREEPSGMLYNVQLGDTLQGLAVKFGVTTEQIRRTNQLWTNDSLFLRDKLLIPIVHENGNGNAGNSPHTSPTASEVNGGTRVNGKNGSICSPDESFESPLERRWTSHPLSDSFESEDCFSSPNSSNLESEPPAVPKSTNPFWSPSEPSGDSNPSTSNGRADLESLSPHSQSTPTSPTPGAAGRRFMVKDHSDNSFQDFLSRIDTAIETSRKQAKSDRDSSKQWVTFESDSESDNPRGSGTSLRTQGRHLRYSLRKLEKAQDELFQL